MLMDVNTGRVYEGDPDALRKELGLDALVEVDPDAMTEKQRAEKQVSLNDHRSQVGKQLTRIRSSLGLTKNQRRNLRKRLRRS